MAGVALAFVTVYLGSVSAGSGSVGHEPATYEPVGSDSGPDFGDRSMLDDGQILESTGRFSTVTSSLRSFDRTVRIGEADAGLVVDSTPVTCHGGLLRIQWHIGNLEPTVPDTGIHLAVRFDGVPVGGLLRGSTRGIWNDSPSGIQAVILCPAGAHVVDLAITSVVGTWGFPYVVNVGDPVPHDLVVNRGFIVTETWGSSAFAAWRVSEAVRY